MHSLREFYASLTSRERNLFQKNLEVCEAFDFIDKNTQQKNLHDKTLLFLDNLEAISDKEPFYMYYHKLTHSKFFNYSNIQNPLIVVFFKALVFTFLLKEDLSKLIDNPKTSNLERLLTKTKSAYDNFKHSNNPIINFYLSPIDFKLLHDLSESLLMEENESTRLNKVAILLSSFESYGNLFLENYELKDKKFKILKEKEQEILSFNRENVLKEALKKQKQTLAQKYKAEKENILESKNAEINKYIKKLEEANHEISKFEANEKKYEKQIQDERKLKKDREYDILHLSKELSELSPYKQKYEDLSKQIQELNSYKQKYEDVLEELKTYQSKMNSSNETTNFKTIFKDWLHLTLVEILPKKEQLQAEERMVIKQLLESFDLPSEINSLEEKTNNESLTNDVDSNETVVLKRKNRIGPAKLDDKGAVFLNGEKIEGIPYNLFIQEGQFILVDSTNRLLLSFPYQIPGGFDILPNTSFVYYDKGQFYNTEKEVVNVKNLPKNRYYNQFQIIAINQEQEYLFYLTKVPFNLERIKNVTDRLGHKMYAFLELLEDQVLCIDIENNKKVLLTLENQNEYLNLQKYSTLLVNGNRIIKTFATPLFYKMSTYYHDKELATVSIKDNVYYVKNLIGEFTKLNMEYSNYELFDGDVVWVDSDNHFLFKENTPVLTDEENKARNAARIKKVKEKEKIDLPELEESILIIGNPSNQNAYQLGFRKYGILAKTIDGYSSYTRIKKEFKKFDKIVFMVNFASHENQDKIKEETDLKVYYPKKDGVNYIYDYIYNNVENNV